MSKKMLRERIQQSILTNDAAMYKALLAVYQNQERVEKLNEASVYRNGVGFNQWDARILSSFAKRVIAFDRIPDEDKLFARPALTERQKEVARMKIVRYWRQLLPAAEAKLAEKENAEVSGRMS